MPKAVSAALLARRAADIKGYERIGCHRPLRSLYRAYTMRPTAERAKAFIAAFTCGALPAMPLSAATSIESTRSLASLLSAVEASCAMASGEYAAPYFCRNSLLAASSAAFPRSTLDPATMRSAKASGDSAPSVIAASPSVRYSTFAFPRSIAAWLSISAF